MVLQGQIWVQEYPLRFLGSYAPVHRLSPAIHKCTRKEDESAFRNKWTGELEKKHRFQKFIPCVSRSFRCHFQSSCLCSSTARFLSVLFVAGNEGFTDLCTDFILRHSSQCHPLRSLIYHSPELATPVPALEEASFLAETQFLWPLIPKPLPKEFSMLLQLGTAVPPLRDIARHFSPRLPCLAICYSGAPSMAALTLPDT